jgi:N-acyl homoserine lactone hydrolase
MMSYTIEIYRNGITSAPGPEIFYLSDWEKEYKLYTYVFIVRNEEHTILIDTGCGDIDAINEMLYKDFGGKISFEMNKDEEFRSIIERSAVDPDKVDYVFISHLHHDHVSNVQMFPNAKIVLSKIGMEAYINANRAYYYNDVLFPRKPIESILARPKEQVLYIEGSADILPGISCHYVGGHTPCSMAVEIETSAGTAICTSDVAFMKNNIVKNHPIGLFYDLWECYDAYELIRNKGAIILTSHDPDILDVEYKEGRVG